MTPLEFRHSLAAEVRKILSTLYLPKAESGSSREYEPERYSVDIYEQQLPIAKADEYINYVSMSEEDNAKDPVPYAIVRLDGGKDSEETEFKQVVKYNLIFCAFDTDRNGSGADAVISMIQRVYMRFSENALLDGGCFVKPFEWAINDEDTYPYFFGAANILFELPRPAAISLYD